MPDGDLIYSQVESFIKRIDAKDIELSPKAQAIILEKITGKDTWGKPIKEKHSLAELIGTEMFAYKQIKNSANISKSNEKMFSPTDLVNINLAISLKQSEIASNLLKYIEQAISHGIVDEVGLTKKITELEKENEKLREKHASLQKLNVELAKENDRLHKLFPDNQKGKSEFGDVHFDS